MGHPTDLFHIHCHDAAPKYRKARAMPPPLKLHFQSALDVFDLKRLALDWFTYQAASNRTSCNANRPNGTLGILHLNSLQVRLELALGDAGDFLADPT